MVYTVRRKCQELPELDYDDGDMTLYLYVKGNPDEDTPEKLVQLLHFMGETTRENACNPSLEKLMEYIDDLRRDPEVKEAYMHWEVFIQSERDEAREEERVKTRMEAARADAAESRASAAERNALEAESRASAAERNALEAESRASAAEQNVLAAENRASAAEQNALEAESRASVAEQNALAAENRASAVEEELERMKAAFAALEKKYRKSVPQSI